MQIEKLVVGSLRENCYIVTNKNNDCLVIDPGDEAKKIINAIGNKKVVGILITHFHFDHIGALDELEKLYNVKNNDFNIKEFSFEVIKTPGHRFDCLTFYFKEESVMFTGDFLFKSTYGRVDLEGSNVLDMKKSLEIIKKYPNDINIFPGHGSSTTLNAEKTNIEVYLKNHF